MITRILNLKYIHLSLSILIVLGTLVCIFTPDFLIFKNSAQYAVRIMLSYLVMGLGFLMLKSYRLMFTSFACCASLCLFLKYTTNSEIRPAQRNQQETIKVAHFNVSATEDYDFILDAISDSKADLISLQEITLDWDKVLKESLSKEYPYSETIVRLDPTGLAVYSKFPMSNVDTFMCGNVPNIVGTVTLDTLAASDDVEDTVNRLCFITTSHSSPPFYTDDYKRLRNHLSRIASVSKDFSCPVLTIGDYGAVPWSTEIVNFRSVSELNDSRRGFFPNSNGYFSIFQLPSDHIFYSDKLECIEFEDMEDAIAGHIGVKGTYQFNQNFSSP